ncbi:rRNA maturation RNase YbeY [candidate division WWE3 bacterium RIFCSPHIGHO2_01_FULL_40_23]|uniref:rRNA maturation RNase YbeY n=1 Tax=candidate division WWE3 bacterium RIFCSPLOWO2_01_FULL_41_18 TaxID=1802625 RepID=A0A1F4VE93_UNCKA|nr:MAG: rRNA maturation RNase YbeY [candidate division WWE3 bacterium RIFCSPHIGHO2_01_FULL_40_23]OGC55489.1 MAG: rRNA maturation RNase YbeY [candidate division WWE3 bacterium RIFCSPLOWO2_01_FULL_41_18]
MKKKSYVNVSFVGDLEMKRLNKKHRGKDYTTDVLSFNINEKLEAGKFYLGDIVINVDQAKRQAKEFGNTYEEEIAELVAHGMLHLQGVHHEDDA